MRRWVALVLLVGLAGQSSGGALAAAPRLMLTVPSSSPSPAPSDRRPLRTQPRIRHTPLPRQPVANYRDAKRYARFIKKRVTVVENMGKPPRLLGPVELRRLTMLGRMLLHKRLAMQGRSHARWTPTGPTMAAGRGGRMRPNDTTATPPPIGTGIERWWTYAERDLPGVGRAFVNVANDNYLIQANDEDVADAGLDLAYRRTYNSQSGHTATNDDGSGPSLDGNRWTSTFDAHLSYEPSTSTTGTITVWDADGTRLDFFCSITTAACAATTAGVYDQLAGVDSINGIYCRWQLTKKSGTSYLYFAPYSGCQKGAGMYGKLLQIDGRNQLNSIQLSYGFTPGDGDPENLGSITATHKPDGLKLQLAFGQPAGGGPTELLSITGPDGQVVDYHYTSTGVLTAVDKPGNNPWLPKGESLPSSLGDGGPAIPAGNLPEVYNIKDDATILEVCGPRAAIGVIPGGATDGGCTDFEHDSNGNLTAWYTRGVLNPTPDDGTDTAIQPQKTTAFQQWGDTQFIDVDDVMSLNGPVYGTTLSDNEGHETTWYYDDLGRVYERDMQTGSTTLTTTQSWGAENNLGSYTDARGFTTRAGYDGNGNAVEVSLPQVNGTLGRPTSLYDYDSTNNLLRYCDPQHSNVTAWIDTNGQDNLCKSNGSMYTQYTYYMSDSNEAYGCLVGTSTPLGYHRAISYGAANSCGSGLPTSVTGDAMAQSIDSATSTRTPTQTFQYNGAGELTDYNAGNGDWVLSYDQMHRVLTITDPAGYTSYKCYNNDGSISYSETPAQHADDSATCHEGQVQQPAYAQVFQYDADGDEYSETHQYGRQTAAPAESLPAGTTYKWYDGLDRLVEVQEPFDQYHDYFRFAWMTRYIYDLYAQQSGPDTITIGNASGLAYGNLYKTQECLPSSPVVNISGPTPGGGDKNCAWTDVRGTTYDALDRVVSQYELADNMSQPISTNVWDTNGQEGYLVKTTNGAGETSTMSYDPDGHLASKSFSDASATDRSYSYDADGRELSVASSQWGGAESKAYDADGNLVSVAEPPNQADAGTITYAYYGDGLRKSLSLNIPLAVGGTLDLPHVLEYAYRSDGLLEVENVDSSSPAKFQGGAYSWTYDPAGRELTQSDPSLGEQQTDLWLGDANSSSWYTTTIGSKTTTYDSYGRIKSVTLPTGTAFKDFTDDDEDEPLSYKLVPPSPPYGNVWLDQANSYTIRGELAGQARVPGAPGYAKSIWMATFSSLAPSPCETAVSGCTLFPPTGGGASSCTPAGPGCAGFDVFADGVRLGDAATAYADPYDGQVGSYDARSGQLLQQNISDCSPDLITDCYQNYTDARTLEYDNAGRQTKTTALGCYLALNTQYIGQPFPIPTPTVEPAGSIETRSYDAENHVIGRTVSIAPGDSTNCPHEDSSTYTLDWGLDGHPWRQTDSTGFNPTLSLHWDGDTLLYTSNPNPPGGGGGTSNDSVTLYIGKLGIVTFSPFQSATWGITTYDRDWSGQTVQTHDDGSFSAPAPASDDAQAVGAHGKVKSSGCDLLRDSLGCIIGNVSYPTPPPGSATPSVPVLSSTATVDMQRDDGYQIGDIAVQGVRAYDPITSQWTTPDAYKGDVDDPMSQKPYMWNNNNPITYSDPSGYCPGALAVVCVLSSSVGGATAAGATAAAVAMGGLIVGAVLATTAHTGQETQLERRAQIVNGAMLAAEHGENQERENETKPSDDKKASRGEIAGIEEITGESIEETKSDGGKNADTLEVWRDTKGDYWVKQRGSKGPGEPLGINRADLPKGITKRLPN